MIGSAGQRVDGSNCDSSVAVFDPRHARLVDRLHELGRSANEITIIAPALFEEATLRRDSS